LDKFRTITYKIKQSFFILAENKIEGKPEEPSQRSLNDVTGGVKKVLKVRPKKPVNDITKKSAVSVNPAASFPLIPIPEPQYLITTAAPTTPASSWYLFH
jgi:hypothetical protein